MTSPNPNRLSSLAHVTYGHVPDEPERVAAIAERWMATIPERQPRKCLEFLHNSRHHATDRGDKCWCYNLPAESSLLRKPVWMRRGDRWLLLIQPWDSIGEIANICADHGLMMEIIGPAPFSNGHGDRPTAWMLYSNLALKAAL